MSTPTEEEYCVGDLILLTDAKKTNKLAQQYTGSYKVLRKLLPLIMT